MYESGIEVTGSDLTRTKKLFFFETIIILEWDTKPWSLLTQLARAEEHYSHNIKKCFRKVAGKNLGRKVA